MIAKKRLLLQIKIFCERDGSPGFRIRKAIPAPSIEIGHSFSIGSFSKCLNVSKYPEFSSGTSRTFPSTALFLIAGKLSLKSLA
jgi:hypothetical protein